MAQSKGSGSAVTSTSRGKARTIGRCGMECEVEKASPEKRAETTRKLVVVTAWAGETSTLPEDPSTVPSIREIA